MVELPLVHLEPWLVSLVGDTVPNFGAEHHLRALHEVVHTVLEGWFACVLINQVKVNLLVRGDLDTNISLDEVDLTSHVVKLFVLGPEASLFVDLEEKDRVRASDYQSFVKEEVHVTEIGIGDFLACALFGVCGVDGESLTLAVKSVAVSGDRTIE